MRDEARFCSPSEASDQPLVIVSNLHVYGKSAVGSVVYRILHLRAFCCHLLLMLRNLAPWTRIVSNSEI